MPTLDYSPGTLSRIDRGALTNLLRPKTVMARSRYWLPLSGSILCDGISLLLVATRAIRCDLP
jgi:hypothetical protein